MSNINILIKGKFIDNKMGLTEDIERQLGEDWEDKWEYEKEHILDYDKKKDEAIVAVFFKSKQKIEEVTENGIE